MSSQFRNRPFAQTIIQRHVFAGSRSVRLLSYVGLAVVLLAGIAVSYSITSAYAQGEPLQDESFLYEIPLFGFSFAQAFFGVAFIVFFCAEWSSGFVYTTYGASQRPVKFVLAKLVWPTVFIVPIYVISLVFLFFVENILVGNGTPYSVSLSDPIVWRQVFVSTFNLLCAGYFAAGLALILRKSAAAVGIFIAMSIIAPIVFGLIPLRFSEIISDWLPNSLYGFLSTQDPLMTPQLNYPALVVAALAYPCVALAIGAYRMKKQPI